MCFQTVCQLPAALFGTVHQGESHSKTKQAEAVSQRMYSLTEALIYNISVMAV